MTFKPCPICGKELTWEKNVIWVDDEGDECDCEDRTELIVLQCRCGFSYACHEMQVDFIIDSNWQDRFEELANRRVKG